MLSHPLSTFRIEIDLSRSIHLNHPISMAIAVGAGALVQWLKLPAWKVGDREFEPRSAFKLQRNKMFFPRALVEIQYCGEPPWPSGSMLGLEYCVWRAVSSHLSHHPQEVLLAQFSLYVHTPFISFHLWHIRVQFRVYLAGSRCVWDKSDG